MNVSRFNILPDDAIAEICNNMDSESIKKFMDESIRNYKICNNIFQKKQEWEQNLAMKNEILIALENLRHPSLVVDASNFNLYGNKFGWGIVGLYTTSNPKLNRISIPDYPKLVIIPDRYEELIDIMDTPNH